jgi:hypothetical protein
MWNHFPNSSRIQIWEHFKFHWEFIYGKIFSKEYFPVISRIGPQGFFQVICTLFIKTLYIANRDQCSDTQTNKFISTNTSFNRPGEKNIVFNLTLYITNFKSLCRFQRINVMRVIDNLFLIPPSSKFHLKKS